MTLSHVGNSEKARVALGLVECITSGFSIVYTNEASQKFDKTQNASWQEIICLGTF